MGNKSAHSAAACTPAIVVRSCWDPCRTRSRLRPGACAPRSTCERGRSEDLPRPGTRACRGRRTTSPVKPNQTKSGTREAIRTRRDAQWAYLAVLDRVLETLLRELPGVTRACPNLRGKGVPLGYGGFVVYRRGPGCVVELDKVLTVPSGRGVKGPFVGV